MTDYYDRDECEKCGKTFSHLVSDRPSNPNYYYCGDCRQRMNEPVQLELPLEEPK